MKKSEFCLVASMFCLVTLVTVSGYNYRHFKIELLILLCIENKASKGQEQ